MSRIDFGWCFFENVEELLLFVFFRVWARACICSLYSCVCNSVLAYTGVFLRLCIHRNGPAYVESCLLTWALTRVHEMLGRSPTLPIFTLFSIVSPPYAILTPFFFVILAFEKHRIILFIFILSLKHHMPKFRLDHESSVIFLFIVITPLC